VEPVAKCEGKLAGIYSIIYIFLKTVIFSKSKGRNHQYSRRKGKINKNMLSKKKTGTA
jgi:hypothetical protein